MTQQSRRTDRVRLREMIEEAIVDAYGDAEQRMGFYNMLEEHLELPFDTTLVGVPVTVRRLDVTIHDQIVAVCVRGGMKQAIGILELPLPTPPPPGSEWIDAYRLWQKGG